MKRKSLFSAQGASRAEAQNGSLHGGRERAAAEADAPPSQTVQNAGNTPQRMDRGRALIATFVSLALMVGGTLGFSALFSRQNAESILYANAGSLALGLALALACAALIVLLPPSRRRPETFPESAADAVAGGAAATDAKDVASYRENPSGEADEATCGGTAADAKAASLFRRNSTGSAAEAKGDGAAATDTKNARTKLAFFLRRSRAVWTLLAGALVAGTEIGLFLLTGSARVSHAWTHASTGSVWLALWLDAELALYPALWICSILPLFEPARFPRLRRCFPLVAAALEAGWLIYARGCTSWTFVLNALLLGGLMYALAGRARRWLPSAAGVFSFFATARLFGETAPVYPVSEPFLTGAEAGGLFGSPILTIFLLIWGTVALRNRVHLQSRAMCRIPHGIGR